MDMPKCKKCLYSAPVNTDEVAKKDPEDWIWPDDWECPFGNDKFPNNGGECDSFSAVRVIT